jgi:hypothetical protein
VAPTFFRHNANPPAGKGGEISDDQIILPATALSGQMEAI